jgi:hypothetical protein
MQSIDGKVRQEQLPIAGKHTNIRKVLLRLTLPKHRFQKWYIKAPSQIEEACLSDIDLSVEA